MEKKKPVRSGGFNNSLPVGAEADVVVVGSGPAGISASIAAARKGLDVILVERFPFLGGMSTQIPIATWPLNTAVETGEMDMPYDGIAGEILKRMESLDALELHTVVEDGIDKFVPLAGQDDRLGTSKWYLFDPETLKYLYFEMLTEAKVKLRVNSLVVDTIVRNKKIEAIVVETLTRRELLKAKIFIDATGSADVVTRSGSPAALGSGDNDGVPAGILMPNSTTFRIAGVDTDNADMYEIAKIYEQHRLKGEINVPLEGLFWQVVCKGVVQIFGTRVFDINPLDPEKAALGEMEQRRQIRDITALLKKEIPAFKDCRLINTGVSMGLIGTRRIRGDYFITQQDIIDAKKFDDAIAAGTYRLEVWEPDGTNMRFNHLVGTWYTIPFRALLPKGLDNVMVAGSCISGQIIAMATWVVMPMCYKTGQAAGTAAYLCIKGNEVPRNIPVAELQKLLREDGIFLGEVASQIH
ncbi:MAG: FAD-dependent oxidoreductase [Dehalococcoidia bacterium]|nr:FAD-dependent oxidoreductase [Dehalococcoidia bacterium]